MNSMYVSYDPEVGATYVQLRDEAVATTRSVSDLLMVDLSEFGEVVGVDFAVPPPRITPAMLHLLVESFPSLKVLADDPERWLYAAH